ncbi:hypothetical protein BMF94_1883 [Rhodotorula taiwanensis]|uniref:Palmitoyltransferase n=1 Tax=Rhodotorula taiwanensis TaxID=741276 RepID=A0A2S5BDR7_9BASI|nr:hypothetical protein BMF94_1883 [Rhodotorula taiwanensis]
MDTLAPLKRVSLDEASKQTDAASSTMSSAQTRVAAPLHQKESLDQSEHTRTAGEAHDALEAGQEKPVRNYRLHQGTNRFCLGGRLMTSGDSLLPLIGSSLVAVLMPALFWAFNGAWLWTELGKGGKASVFVFLALVLFMWASMARTALSDPGILPRDLDPDPPQRYLEPDPDDPDSTGQWIVEVKYVQVPGKGYVASKWCPTCHIYRPPRTSHCRLCDNCVERTDHHCAFLNNCIGRRNYRPFILFLTTAVLAAFYAIAFTLYHIVHALTAPGSTGWRWDTIGALVVAVFAVLFATPLAGLLAYHVRLMWSNRTTIELLRPAALRGGLVDPSTGLPLLVEEGGTDNPWRRSNPLGNVKDALGAPRRGSRKAKEGLGVKWRDWAPREGAREAETAVDMRPDAAGSAVEGQPARV